MNKLSLQKKIEGFDVTVLPRSVEPGPARIFSQRPVCLGVDVNTQSCHLDCAHIKNVFLLWAYQKICDVIFYLTATWVLVYTSTDSLYQIQESDHKWMTVFCSHLKHHTTINSDGNYRCPCFLTLHLGDSGCVDNPCVCINRLLFVNDGFYPFHFL